jgi:hypothetical protein
MTTDPISIAGLILAAAILGGGLGSGLFALSRILRSRKG